MTINYLAVLVCAIISMVIGSIWYGPLFGKTWMKIMGAEHMSEHEKAVMKKRMNMMYFIQFVLSVITAGVLDYFIIHGMSAMSAVSTGLLVWFGFILPTEGGAALWGGKSSNVAWKMFLISAGSALVTFVVYALILSAWR